MRIIALADLHFDTGSRPRIRAIAQAVEAAGADALVLAGDCAASGPELIPEALDLFAGFDGPRLMVPGNHDLWQAEPPFATARLYEQTIPAIAAAHGFHLLDREPFLLGDTAFVGVMGWYSYALRQRKAPRADLTVTPVQVARGADGGMEFAAAPGMGEKCWEELSAEDYVAGGLIWQAEGAPHVAVWNDALHLDWGRSDLAIARDFVERLRSQVAAVAGRARRVVGVTHFVPFAELAEHHLTTPTRAFARAYLGDPALGEALLEAEGLALVIYGHRHRQEVREVRGVVTADAGVADQDAGPLVLTLPD
jgi:predicted phosphodiesterase